MNDKIEKRGRWHEHQWRIALWAGVALVLLLPLAAMQLTDEVNWSIADFIFAGVLLAGTGLAYELAVRKSLNTLYRAAAGIALAAALLLIWLNGAVGIIGSENNEANLMYGGVLAVGLLGAFLTRLQPRGMAHTLFATAFAQVVVAVIAWIAGFVPTYRAAVELFGVTGFFVALFVSSAFLFQRAARAHSVGGAESGH